MASVTVFDPGTANSKTINVDMGGSIVIQDLNGDLDYYVRLSTSAKMKNGGAIAAMVIRTLNNGAGAGGNIRYKHPATPLPYENLTVSIQDHIARMVEGDGVDPNTAMKFST
jgi:hypothetical protein